MSKKQKPTHKPKEQRTPSVDLQTVRQVLDNYASRLVGVSFRMGLVEEALHGLHHNLAPDSTLMSSMDEMGVVAVLEIISSYAKRESVLLSNMQDALKGCGPDDEWWKKFLETYGDSEHWENADVFYGEGYEDDPFEIFKRFQIPGGKA